MTATTFNRVRLVIMIIIIEMVGFSIYTSRLLLALLAIPTGMLFLNVFKRNVKEVIEDERVTTISQMAARSTLITFIPALALTSLLFLILSKPEDIFLEAVAVILSYVTMLAIALYAIFYKIFSKKFGA